MNGAIATYQNDDVSLFFVCRNSLQPGNTLCPMKCPQVLSLKPGPSMAAARIRRMRLSKTLPEKVHPQVCYDHPNWQSLFAAWSASQSYRDLGS